jgi:preprotein translocase subunit SecF
MNQVLARSINTSLVAILPVLSVLVIGAELLGASTLQYFGLALVIGLTSGAYSSIFIASPILSQLKEREPRYVNIRQKLANRDSRVGLLTPAAAAVMSAAGDTTRRASRPTAKKQATTIRPAARAGARPTQTARRTVAASSGSGGVDVLENGSDGAVHVDADENGGAAAATSGTTGAARSGAARSGAAGSGAARAQGNPQPRRPPPRPRKGKGRGKGQKRR